MSIEEQNTTESTREFLPPDHGEICWINGSETFTRKEVAAMLHTQRSMISNDLIRNDYDNLSQKTIDILNNQREVKF